MHTMRARAVAAHQHRATLRRMWRTTALALAAIVCGLLVVLVASAAYLAATQAINFALN